MGDFTTHAQRAKQGGLRGPSGRISALALGLGLIATGCAGSEASTEQASDVGAEAGTAAEGEPFRVGVLNPLSGNVAFLGTAQYDVFEAYFDRVNAEGGIGGHPVELVAEDNEAAVDKSLSGLRALADEDVSVVLGPSVSGNVEAVAPLAEDLGLSVIAIGAYKGLLDPPQQYLFQVDSTSASNARMAAEFAADLFPDKEEIRAALIPIDTPSSFAWRDDLQERWGPENGLTFTSSTTIPLTAEDLTVAAQTAVSDNPDVVLTQALDASLPLLVGRMRELGFDGPVVGYHAGNADSTLMRMGDENVFVPKEMRGMSDDAEGRPGLQFMQETIAEAGLEEAMKGVTQSSLGWMGAEIVAGVLEECGYPCDASAFNEALRGISIDTEGVTFEPITFSEDDHQGVESVTMYHWDGQGLARYSDTTYSTSVYD